ncbi:MAG: AAA family ATPase [Chloroflexi bacterium]|nr:AAA family ATPase [Chloroflexota bacterium]
MKLLSAQVSNYKCILDSGLVEIEPDLTCFLGKNESGKTAFLETLYKIHPLATEYRTTFNGLNDYPRIMRGTGMLNIAEFKPIVATFELEDSEVKEIEDLFGKGMINSRTITVAKNYGNELLVEFDINERAFINRVAMKNDLGPTTTNDVNTVEELWHKLTAMENRSPVVEKLRKDIEGFDLTNQVKQQLIPHIPKFIYFNEYSLLPSRFSIPYIFQSQRQSNHRYFQTARALMRLAKINAHDLTQGEYENRKAVLEAAASQVTKEVFEFWQQNQELRVDFDIDFKPGEDPKHKPPFLDIRIWNDRHRVSLKFSERSRGFVWFFSFLVYFSELQQRKEKIILLLDEPGLGLHASGQKHLLRFLEERIADKHQVIYTTHSPFMIDTSKMRRLRIVEDHNTSGTKIGNNIRTASQESISPIQAALGHQLTQSFLLGPENLIVNNAADTLYLQVISTFLRGLGRTGLHPKWTLIPAGGIENLPPFFAMLETEMQPSVLYNVTPKITETLNPMLESGMLKREKIFPVTEITGTSEADLEDLFNPGFYLTLLRGAGVADLREEDLPDGERIRERIERFLGKKINTLEPALHLMREQGFLLSSISGETLDRFEQLFFNINKSIQ